MTTVIQPFCFQTIKYGFIYTSATSPTPGTTASSTAQISLELEQLKASVAAWAITPGPKKTSLCKASSTYVTTMTTTKPPISLQCIICTKPCLHTWSRSNGFISMLNHVERTHSAFLLEVKASIKKLKKKGARIVQLLRRFKTIGAALYTRTSTPSNRNCNGKLVYSYAKIQPLLTV